MTIREINGVAKSSHDRRSGGGDAGDRRDIDRVRPAVLRQVEPAVAADQRQVAAAILVDIAGLAARYDRLLGRRYRLAGTLQLGGGELAQILARRHQCEATAGSAD